MHQAEAQVATAEANLSQAQAGYEQARYDAERFTRLARPAMFLIVSANRRTRPPKPRQLWLNQQKNKWRRRAEL